MPYINDVIAKNKQQNQEKAIKQDKQQSKKQIGEKQNKIVSRFLFEPNQIIQDLKKHIIGQDEAIADIEDTLYRIKAEINEENKPLCVLFLLGPTGVGKTETVNLLAKYITGTAQNLCRIDMNTLSQNHYAASLSGSPPGYAGSKENQTLFDKELISGSYSRPGIILFDEIEKASSEVVRSLLGVLDSGMLTLTSGTKTIDFSNSLIFLTSNLGSEALLKKKLLSTSNALHKQRSHKKTFTSLEKKFDPEFLNRIERFVFFKPLESSSINHLIDIEFNNLNQRVKHCNAVFTLSNAARQELKSAYQRQYGARNIHHRIRRDIEPLIARFIVKGELSNKADFCIGYDGQSFKIESLK